MSERIVEGSQGSCKGLKAEEKEQSVMNGHRQSHRTSSDGWKRKGQGRDGLCHRCGKQGRYARECRHAGKGYQLHQPVRCRQRWLSARYRDGSNFGPATSAHQPRCVGAYLGPSGCAWTSPTWDIQVGEADGEQADLVVIEARQRAQRAQRVQKAAGRAARLRYCTGVT